MTEQYYIGDQVLTALRRVIRAVDLHSRTLAASHGLTGPQALILKALQKGNLTAGALAKSVSLSHATVTDILNRLEQKELIKRVRDIKDRRKVMVEITHEGITLLEQSPPLLQDRFINRFSNLQEWEQTSLLAALQRIAAMMDAEELDAAPVLSSGSIRATAKTVEQVLEPLPVPTEKDAGSH